jgi:hypothetical protein
MKHFYIADFPRFDDYVDNIWLVDSSIKVKKMFMDEGLTSITSGPRNEGWLLSEEDYTWFVLKWS